MGSPCWNLFLLIWFFFFLDSNVIYVTKVFFFGFFEVAMVNGCWTCLLLGLFWCWICLVVVSWLTIGVSFHSPLVYWFMFIVSLLKFEIATMEIVCSVMEIVNCTVDQRPGYAWWRLGLCLPWVFFFAMDLLLRCGSSSSFFLSVEFPSFFFLSSGFSSFSWFVVFCSMYFEIECKILEIYVAKTCPSQQVGSKSEASF